MRSVPNTLILAWGNPGRQDDGLGPAFGTQIAAMSMPEVTVDGDYQLQVEDAAAAAQFQRVVFADADRNGAEPFRFQRVQAGRGRVSFSTHSVSPETVLALSRDLFGAEPEAWILGVRGYEFDDFGESLSTRARENLTAAVEFVREAILTDTFREIQPKDHKSQTEHDCIGDPCEMENR